MICKFILLITVLNMPEDFFYPHLNGFKYFYLIQLILFTTDNEVVTSIAI